MNEKQFEELYQKSVGLSVTGDIAALFDTADCDAHALDCLTNPRQHPAVVRLGPCECDDKSCANVCFYNAISHDASGHATISAQDCAGCGDCIKACDAHNLVEIKEVVPIFGAINEGKPVYALVAPAFLSQFGADMTPGRLRTAFKNLGFAGMIEVALFADILTLKEALEFDRSVTHQEDFVLTSCCCPMWVAMIQKVYSRLVKHVPPSVSPMVACGRAIKMMHPDAKTVFVGPCLAKKAEARIADIADAVDYVLTFREIQDIFEAAGIDPQGLEEDLRDHSSAGGRMYARTGGVSEAVSDTLNGLRPGRTIPLKSRQGDGVPACKQILKDVMEGHIDANFVEGMGCVGGCVGGPRALIPKEEGKANVDAYADKAASRTPVNNAFVRELLQSLGFDTIESLLEGENMFTRRFDG
jgi:iron only hydrogenase large subunit-like protein